MKQTKNIISIALAVFAIALSAGCSTTTKSGVTSVNKITPKAAVRFAPYAMMAANSYHNPKRTRFPVEQLGWQQIDLQDKPTSDPTYTNAAGLAFDVFRQGVSNEYVFVFRGTDRKGDYLSANLAFGISPQYKSAIKQFRHFNKAHPAAHIVVIGHSLGGGLALSVSVHDGIDAMAFDSTPRVFDGLFDRHQPALREMIYQEGEALIKFRKISTKFSDVVEDRNIYECNFDFGKTSKHSAQMLAKEILRLGATRDTNLRNVLNALPK